MIAGDLPANALLSMFYDGSAFRLNCCQTGAAPVLYAWGGTATGTANAVTIPAPLPAISSYGTGGLQLAFLTGSASNTGPVTVQVGSLGAVNVVGSAGAPLAAGALPANSLVTTIYDGTSFRLTAAQTRVVRIKGWAGGATGRGGGGGAAGGGAGGAFDVTFNLAPGTVITLMVGKAGSAPATGLGGVGGGLSGVFLGSVSQANALAIAGGGGAGAASSSPGGGGGGTAGGDGTGSSPGLGGTANSGGSGGAGGGGNGTALQGGIGYNGNSGTAVYGGGAPGGGDNSTWTSGGGGGGYFGGGGGGGPGGASPGGSGGGGSGYIASSRAGYMSGTPYAATGATPGNSSDPDRGTAGNPAADGKIMVSYDGGNTWATYNATGADQTITVP